MTKILGENRKIDYKRRRPLAIAWTRICRELGRALAEHERLDELDPPPGLPGDNTLPELNEALHEMMAYRDVLRDWADLPPGDNDANQANLTDAQAEMVDQLNAMEDALNERGHSMTEREAKEGKSDMNDSAWPPRDVVAKLVEAVEHLLSDHNCDAHGYEEVGVALEVARGWLDREMVPERREVA